MRKLTAAINITLDGFCDHTAIIPADEMHEHYTDLLNKADAILYGRITYQLMEYWQTIVKDPTGDKAEDEFAIAIDNIPKIVFSNTLNNIEWESAKLATRSLKDEVIALKQQTGKKILVGSPSLIVALTKLNLIDEYQLCVHPVIVGNGLPLFKNISEKVTLKFLKSKTFDFGAVALYYEPKKNDNTLN